MHSLKRQSTREVCKQVTDMHVKHRGFFVWFGFFSLSFLGASGIAHKSSGSCGIYGASYRSVSQKVLPTLTKLSLNLTKF